MVCRWKYCVDPTIKRGKWTAEEDKVCASFSLALFVSRVLTHRSGQALLESVKVYVDRNEKIPWTKVCEAVPGRHDQKCRERYVNILSPALKRETWTQEEDDKLLELIGRHGPGKWALIAAEMGNMRTDNQVWRRWKRIAPQDVTTPYLEKREKKRKKLPTNYVGRVKERTELSGSDVDEEDASAEVMSPGDEAAAADAGAGPAPTQPQPVQEAQPVVEVVPTEPAQPVAPPPKRRATRRKIIKSQEAESMDES